MARNVTSLLIAGVVAAISGQHAAGQTSSVQSPQAMPSYEVATIKPAGPNGFAIPLRVYIQAAFGIPVNTTGWVIGPDWINSTKYAIQGKPPDSIEKAMQTMTFEERKKQVDLMEQNLLADRFKLKAHFETREMPMYQLVVAKDGPKLKENLDLSHSQFAVGASGFRAIALPMARFAELLEAVPDIGGRVVVDKTGLSGSYDFTLQWTPLGAVPSGDAEGESFFAAIEEHLDSS